MDILQSTTHPGWLILFGLGISFVPMLMGISTSYLKVSIVLGLLKSGLGAQQVPGNMVIMSLSLAITLFVMGPVIDNTTLLLANFDKPSLSEIPTKLEIEKMMAVTLPWKSFLKKHSAKEEIKTFQKLKTSQVETKNSEVKIVEVLPEDDIWILLPAFMLTELKEAFSIGFVLLLPFLVIDLVVSNILAGMGMMMVSPVMISLPIKLLIFVLCDGWTLITRGLVQSYV
ncbi:MAG: flagellar type III secretion system pore protein FliP [bacterium]|nr:flagellar type III secretion system pore protein FliP [bacterium]